MMIGLGRPDLERTVADPSPPTPEPSRASQDTAIVINAVAPPFIPRPIPNRSWVCTRDVIITLCATVGSVFCGIGASDSSDTTPRALFAGASALFGVVATRMTLYGVMIRCCPQSQQFWFRRRCIFF